MKSGDEKSITRAAIIVSAAPTGKRGPGLPARLAFHTALTVQAADVNAGGHLGHDRAVSLLHEARARFLHACGMNEAGGPAAPGVILLQLEVGYHAEAFWGDMLDARLGVLELSQARLALGYRLERAGTPIVTARSNLAFFDYTRRRPCRAPDTLIAALKRYVA